MNLDLRQRQAARAVGLERGIPVLYITQLMGLAFGMDVPRLGLEKLCVDARPLLDKLQKARSEAASKEDETSAKVEVVAKKAHKAEVRP